MERRERMAVEANDTPAVGEVVVAKAGAVDHAKHAYRLSWLGALVRTFLLLNFSLITASLFFVPLLGIGALG